MQLRKLSIFRNRTSNLMGAVCAYNPQEQKKFQVVSIFLISPFKLYNLIRTSQKEVEAKLILTNKNNLFLTSLELNLKINFFSKQCVQWNICFSLKKYGYLNNSQWIKLFSIQSKRNLSVSSVWDNWKSGMNYKLNVFRSNRHTTADLIQCNSKPNISMQSLSTVSLNSNSTKTIKYILI